VPDHWRIRALNCPQPDEGDQAVSSKPQKKLHVIGRAGLAVDNVDVDAATRRGVIVMNTPGGNTISRRTHVFDDDGAGTQHSAGHMSMKAGKWDGKSFEGVELYNKTLASLAWDGSARKSRGARSLWHARAGA